MQHTVVLLMYFCIKSQIEQLVYSRSMLELPPSSRGCLACRLPYFNIHIVLGPLVTRWEAPGGFGASSGLWLANFSLQYFDAVGWVF